MKLNIIGPYFTPDGYGSHVRQLAKAINDEGIEVSISSQRPANWLRGLSDDEFNMLKRNPEDADINLVVGIPSFWPIYMSEPKPFIGFFVWEGNKVPVSWIDIFLDERCKQIWVPSIHTKDAILNTEKGKIAESKIKVVPHGVNLDIFKPIENKDKKRFTFVMSGGWPKSWYDRKGLSYGIKAYMEEFTNKDDVEMVVKVNSAYGLDFNKNIKDLDIKNKNVPKLTAILDNLAYPKLVEVYNKGDVFVNTSLADGFNLNCIEAMACGLPVLTTDFGGQIDFVNKDNGWILEEGEMKEAHILTMSDMIYEGIKWKIPCIDEIRKKLRELYNKKDVKDKSSKAIEKSKEYAWKNTGTKAKQFLNELVIK